MPTHFLRILGIALALALCGAVAARAQTTSGRIAGTVVDTSGAAIAGVTVTITEDRTGFIRSTTTDTTGAFVFVSLPVGSYSVSVELTGFKKEVKTGYELVADGRLTADFTLDVGFVSEVIEVTVLGETVNAASGEIARVVDREQVQSLALNGRNYLQLASLIPGAPVMDQNLNALDMMTGLGINTPVNGSRGNASLLMVDGGFNMDSGSNNSQVSNVGIDFIQEVSIKTANFSAEYGRNSGAAINVVTRAGTNNVTGSLYGYHRNDSLDANDFFNNARGVDRTRLRYHDFGWTLGGPVQKSKLFFFAGQEWKVIRRSAAPRPRTLPTRAMRQGNFSDLTTPIRDPLTGQPFPGNVIPANRITADGRAIANLYTAMEERATSYTDRAIANNALFQGDNPFDFRQDVIRLDYQASDDHRLTGRVIYDDYDLVDPFGTFIGSQLPTIPTNRERPGRNYQLSHIWTMRNDLINEFRANASWHGQRISPQGDAWKRDTYGFTFPQLFSGGGRFDDSIPDVDMTGYATFRGAAQSLISPTTDIQVSDHLTWLQGNHIWKIGGMAVRNRKDQNGRSQYAGSAAFSPAGNPRSTGDAFADALLGNFRRYREAQSDPVGMFRFWQAEGFLSDNWRLSRNLSVEVGIRYAWHQPIYTQANNMASFDPARYDPSRAVLVLPNGTLVPGVGDRYNGLVRAGQGVPEDELIRVPNGNSPQVQAVEAGAPRGFYDAQHLFAPRLSFAWTPGDGLTAVRGGVGLFYDRPEGDLYFGTPAVLNSPPYNLSAEYENGNLSAPGGGTVPALAPIAELGALDPNLRVPRSRNWSVSVQRELPWGIFGEIAYVGSKGQNLLRFADINQPPFEALIANAALPAAQRANTNFLRPYKGYSAIRMRLSDVDSTYHALQVYANKRRGDLLMTLSYTYSKARDTASNNFDNPEDYANQDYNYGPSDFDRPHVAVATWTWHVPFFRAQRGVGWLLGGWDISGIGRFQSGAPLTVLFTSSIGIRRADLTGADLYVPASERFGANPGQVRWLNPAAFTAAPEGRRGNSARGQVRSPSIQVWDVSLRKQFPFGGDVRLQLQADLFNVLNHTNLRFASQTLNISTAGFGELNVAVPPRNVQLGLRLTF